jgi:UDP-N-acetylmuramoyl-tripeptide--D-alanyl-D-alanine ligase
MIEMDMRAIADATGGRLIQNGGDVRIQGISTDSRSLQPGELFIPLRGEHFDGHDFLAQAARHGAAACLSEETVVGLPIPVIQVRDTLKALGDLAATLRNRFKGPVIGITGTSGKTTTKEMLASILSRIGEGHKSAGNFNNLIGVPLTLFGLRPEHQWAVVEMGMSERGEIARLTEIAAPMIGVITNVGRAHLESLGGIDAVARAKGELFANLPPGGTALVNADDEYVLSLPVANGVRRVLFGLSAEAQVRGGQVSAHNGVIDFSLHLAGEVLPVRLPLPGRHNVMNALAAAAAAQVLDVPGKQIVAGLESFKPCPGRMELVELPNDILLLDDSYNANPLSVRAALDALHDMGRKGRRIALLGDMLELGAAAGDLHREVGKIAAECVDWLFLLGELAREIGKGAADAGLNPAQIVVGESHQEVAARIGKMLQPGDRLLIKGSRGMRLEQVVALLRARPTKPGNP